MRRALLCIWLRFIGRDPIGYWDGRNRTPLTFMPGQIRTPGLPCLWTWSVPWWHDPCKG